MLKGTEHVKKYGVACAIQMQNQMSQNNIICNMLSIAMFNENFRLDLEKDL